MSPDCESGLDRSRRGECGVSLFVAQTSHFSRGVVCASFFLSTARHREYTDRSSAGGHKTENKKTKKWRQIPFERQIPFGGKNTESYLLSKNIER